MADIATVFGWGPAEMAAMTPPDLARWRDRARTRIEAQQGARRKGG